MRLFLIITFVAIIICIQVILYLRTKNLIETLKAVLSGDFSSLETSDEVPQIVYQAEDSDPVSLNIQLSINTYLNKNKGAVSDFNLIKDIVERNCDTLEAEISSQTPLPLYLGLMGTVAGIIIGLFSIAVGGGFSNIEQVVDILMSEVAIAMIASFMGIGLTTLALWKSKQCKVIVEANKNKFYTWIQTNLLPVISKSAVSAITLLQQNLTRFNESFTKTIDKLETRLDDVGSLYDSQITILEKIEEINVKKMASANLKVLSALDGSMESLERFSKYMENVTDYLVAVRDLNDKLDDHLERTETLGVVSDFYKKQMKEIEFRQEAIRAAVVSVDDVMKSALATLKENSESGLKSMQESFVTQMVTMQEMVAKQTARINEHINNLPKILNKLDEISSIPSKLDKMIDKIEKSNNALMKQMSQSARTGGIALQPAVNDMQTETSPKWFKLSLIAGIFLIVLACIANLTVNIISVQSREGMRDEVDNTSIVADSVANGLQPSSDNSSHALQNDASQVGEEPAMIPLEEPNEPSANTQSVPNTEPQKTVSNRRHRRRK